ncbi:MAG: hypothetical protein ACI97B_001730 [Verrucomicrobiales bacterium]|jgi:hypothetical protein
MKAYTSCKTYRFLALALMTIGCLAQTPTISSLSRFGGERGKEHEITFSGKNLQTAEQILFHKPGIAATKFEPIADKGEQVKVTIKIEAAAEPGEVPFRLRTRKGLSAVRTFHIGHYPDVEEAEPNSEIAAAQTIPMNCTVNAVVKNEDVDYFKVDAAKGQRITAEVVGIRLGHFMLDAYVAILDMNRFELGSSDDSPLALQDGVVSVLAPEDGQYLIQVRESSYRGDDRAAYRLHVGTFPRPLAVFPMGGKPGSEIDFRFIGDPGGAFQQKMKLGELKDVFPVLATKDNQLAPSPNFVRVTDLTDVYEKAEPHGDRGKSQVVEPEAPLAINGVLETAEEDDWYRFKAKKGQVFEVNAYARRLRSPLDSVINLYHAKDGKSIAGNDDFQNQPDSYLRFTVPEDGEYDIRIKDHLGKGGPDFVYRIEISPVVAALAFNQPEFEPNTQIRQAIQIPVGGRYSTVFSVKRSEFDGELKAWFENLPPGVTAQLPAVIQKDVTTVPVVFIAAPDAPIGGALARFKGELIDKNRKVAGGYTHMTTLVYGQPNNTTYYGITVDQLEVAVIEPPPFEIELVQPKSPLVHGGTKFLKVIAKRKEGFDEAIKVKMLFKPPGVNSSSEITIAKGKSAASYRVSAGGGARTWKIAVIGQADAGGGRVYAGSNFIDLEVASPFVNGKIEMVATERGLPVEVVCTLNQLRPFDGEATLVLSGLPAKCATEPQKITKDTKEVIFPVTTAPDSPLGQHKSMFCTVTITQNEEPVLSSIAGGSVFRLDPPPPPKKKPPPKVAKVELAAAPPAPKPKKRLSRLEKLRLQKQEEMKGGGAER